MEQFFNKLKEDLSLRKVLDRNVRVSSIEADFGPGFYIGFILIPWVCATIGFIGDYLVVQSIIDNATKMPILATFLAVILAFLIQGLLYQIPSGVGKNFRFAFNYTKANAKNKNASFKRPIKKVLISLIFLAMSTGGLLFSLFLNQQADGIVMKITHNEDAPVLAAGTHASLIAVQKTKSNAQKQAQELYDNAIKRAESDLTTAINNNATARAYKEKSQMAAAEGQHEYAAKMMKNAYSSVKKEVAIFEETKAKLKEDYNKNILSAEKIALFGETEITGGANEVKEFQEKSKQMLEMLLKHFLKYVNIYTFLSGLILGFIAKDIRENENDEIDLTALDAPLARQNQQQKKY